MKNFSRHSRCAERYSNRAPAQFKSRLWRLHRNNRSIASLLFIGIQLPTLTKNTNLLRPHKYYYNVCRPCSLWRSFDYRKNLLKIQSENLTTYNLGLKLIIFYAELMECRNRFHFRDMVKVDNVIPGKELFDVKSPGGSTAIHRCHNKGQYKMR
jgi:hypothetical protein